MCAAMNTDCVGSKGRERKRLGSMSSYSVTAL